MLVLTSLFFSCEDRRDSRLTKTYEPYVVVQGNPTVQLGKPSVSVDGTQATSNFGIAVPRQCDLFQQSTVRKVDILWVVDSSGSMAPKQERLAANFTGFMNQLVTQRPPIDFHIAVATSDTDAVATRGKLLNWSVGGKSGNYIACTPDVSGGLNCNTHPTGGQGTVEAETAFRQLVQKVGTSGSAQERGLYATYLVLKNEENLSSAGVTRFIREDAALYVVIVSDEDDASCSPMGLQSTCTADPGCRCAPNNVLEASGAYGSTDYFVRFLEAYKGFGRQDLVALAAIVAVDDGPDAGVPSQFGEPSPHVGCQLKRPDGGSEIAYHGNRYIKVASETGGVAVSICEENFAGALAALGYSASGLRREFRLSRGPVETPDVKTGAKLEVFVSPPAAASCSVDGNCPPSERCRAGRCARSVSVASNVTSNSASYLKCEGANLRNAVRFEGTSVPESLSAVEVCYDVQASNRLTCP